MEKTLVIGPNLRTTSRAPSSSDFVTRETYRPQRDRTTRTTLRPWRLHVLKRADLIIAGAVFLIAILARWPFIQSGETLLNPDEAIVGLMSQDIAAGERFPIYFYGQRYMGSFEAFVIAAVSPFFEHHVQALRFGPALVFAAFATLQYLMLTRWLGRRAGLSAAALLICASPMFMHWSISARGGYIEILLWGTALMWAYTERFVPRASQRPPSPRARFAFGALLGSGLWINPSIALFVAPIVLHALLARPLAFADASPATGRMLATLRHTLGRTTLVVAGLAAILALNVVWAVWVDPPQIRSLILLGLLPTPVAMGLLVLTAAALAIVVARRTPVVPGAKALLMRNAAMILGMAVGATPAILYAVRSILTRSPLEPSLPLGIRPLWLTGETLVYLIHGLPMLFAADPRPFVRLMSVGHPDVTHPLDVVQTALANAGNWLVIGALLSAAIALAWTHRRALARLARLEPANHPPAILLALAVATTLVLYVFGGCTMNFSTVRYLVPLWAFVPGLLASLITARRLRRTGPAIVAALCLAWSAGQSVMHAQLGRPHPLRAIASALVADGVTCAVAEPLDAHLLSYLTDRRCKVAEFESFWVRLPHYQGLKRPDGAVDYVVDTSTTDWTAPWTTSHWPGTPPPETTRFLWPRLRRALIADPTLAVSRRPLCHGYELIRLRHPLPARSRLVPPD